MMGEAFALGSALAWAVGVILYKRLGAQLPPLRLNLAKNSLVLVLLLPLTALWHGSNLPALTPAVSEIAICIVSGLIGIALADTLYFRALNQIGAGRMGIVGNFYSPFVLVLAFVFLGERLTPLQFAGFGLVTLGVAIVAERGASEGLGGEALWRGVLLGIVSVLLMAVAIVMVKRVLERNDVLVVSAIRLAGGVGGMILVTTALRAWSQGHLRRLDRRGWAFLVIAAVVGQLLAMVMWLAGYKYTSASIAAILNESSSVFIVLLAWLVLREPMTRRKLVGVACTLGGVGLMLV
jgi:drug/metabolite transporter (DMT)-like permease